MNKRGGQIAFRAARFFGGTHYDTYPALLWINTTTMYIYFECYQAWFDLIYNRNLQRPLPFLLL